VLLLTHAEIPHGVAVEIEAFEETGEPERERVHINAAIYCDKDSHKGILIGKQGSMLKNIGTQARLSIEEMTGCPCYLELFVKVREDWRNRRDILRNLGLDSRS
jgi:GTPase Era involved in 16S rRNA processing